MMGNEDLLVRLALNIHLEYNIILKVNIILVADITIILVVDVYFLLYTFTKCKYFILFIFSVEPIFPQALQMYLVGFVI